MTDGRLLKEYIDKGSEAAFSQLVDKHLNLVYWTCRRDIGHEQLAEDATQSVFLLLAQKARYLQGSQSISGWLFSAARLVSRNAARMERRRQRYEVEAAETMDNLTSLEPGSKEIEPWLNEALAILTPAERETILLRYFEDLSFREIGERLGSVENTAAKRARYAIDKMRRHLARNGVVASAVTLTTFLADESARAAPASCRSGALQAVHQAFATRSIGQASGSKLGLLHKGVYFTMQATKYKYLTAATVLALLAGGGYVGWRDYDAHAMASATGSGSFTDNIPASGSSPSASDQKVIVSQMKQFVDGFNRHDLATVTTVISPSATFTDNTPTGRITNRDQFIEEGRQEFEEYPNAKIDVNLASVIVTGDQATMTCVVKFEGGNPKDPGPKTDTFHWDDRSGTWLIDGGL